MFLYMYRKGPITSCSLKYGYFHNSYGILQVKSWFQTKKYRLNYFLAKKAVFLLPNSHPVDFEGYSKL